MARAAEHTTREFANYPPIDPRAVAARFGATVTHAPGERSESGALSDHGTLTVRDGRWHINVPLQMSGERRRFSVAHEIGHILLFTSVADQPALVRQLRSREIYRRVERLCNSGAAHILMPTAPFTESLAPAGPPTKDLVEMLASKFNVSLEAAARRITEIQPGWHFMMWEHSTTHPKGPAWRTAKQPQRENEPFLPDGMSSSRLVPDVVLDAARKGVASCEEVIADLPSVGRMRSVRAWHVPRVQRELVQVDGRAPQKERVFVFYRTEARA